VLRRAAIFLDFDGTLVEIAPTPEMVKVDPALPSLLKALCDRLGGALALVSGRPLETLDAFLAPVRLPAACEHGVVLRASPDGEAEEVEAVAVPESWRAAAASLAASAPGAIYEPKRHGFALHARCAPEALPAFEAALRKLIAGDDRFLLLPAHMAWEVKSSGTNKGTAIEALMSRSPFSGRLPVFIGDDVTDEDAIKVVTSLGGTGLRVHEAFGNPAGVRAWLSQLLDEADHAAAP
jgi:trehalose 6-phosphate phosphatase